MRMEFIAHSHSLLGHSKLVVRAVSSKERKIEAGFDKNQFISSYTLIYFSYIVSSPVY